MDEQPEHQIDDKSTQEPPLTKKQRRMAWVLSAFAFFVSYVLSAGPAVFVMDKIDQPFIASILEMIYAPLVLIIKLKVPILGPLIKGYVELFQ